MAPKTTTTPSKLASILSYFHKSGVAHSIKDLEKALPSVASINGMQVKDYLQALADDSKIRVEKIGSGNWYWAFAGEEAKAKEREVERAREEGRRAEEVVAELEGRVGVAVEERRRGGAEGEGDGRDEMEARVEALRAEVEALRAEVKAFSGCDPVAVGRKRKELEALKGKAGRWTEQVWVMEGYLKGELGMERERLEALKREVYGAEYVEEEGGLGDVV